MSGFESIVTAAMTLTAGAISTLAILAWHHSGSRKVLFVAIGFLLFFIKGVVLSIGLFAVTDWGGRLLPFSVVLDLAVLVLFYLAILQRAGD